MSTIPFKAFSMGAESINEYPVKYNRARTSGSNEVTYNLHIKGACMPGQKNKFTTTPISRPEQGENLQYNKIMSSFMRAKINLNDYKIKNTKNILVNQLKIIEFEPNDDESFLIAINSLYRNIFGNFSLMESEKPIEIERRLRNGDITIKEFTRNICKSNIYRKHYFENISQYTSIKLRYKHILGRPIIEQTEIIKSAQILNEIGFEAHIDWLIDSDEYYKTFGDNIVPYIRSWNSSVGLKTKSFLDTSSLTKSFASSDIS